MTDAELIQAVRDASAAGATPQNAEDLVGMDAIINTSRPGDRDKLAFAHLELDPAEQSEIPSLEVNDLAYWGRPGDWENVNVVGLAWDATGQSPKTFFAIVYPPG